MSNTNNNETSTLQAVQDQVSGAVQSAIGTITGNPADKQQAENKKATADAERDLSDSAAKAGPYTVHPSGGVAKDDPNRTQGSWNQTVGAGKEFIGNAVGAEGLRQEGERQNKEGKGQEAQGQMSDLGKGVQDRVGGTLGSAVAGLTGNESQKDAAQRQREEGKARQRGVEVELQKEADKQQ